MIFDVLLNFSILGLKTFIDYCNLLLLHPKGAATEAPH